MTNRQMQGWILNSVRFVRNFTTCRCFCFLGIILYSDKIFYSPRRPTAGHNRGHPRCNIIHWFVFFVLWTIVRVRFIVKDALFSFFLSELWIKLLDEVEQNIVICQWRADQLFTEAEVWGKIIDVRDTGKSRYFVITEFNNCFIIRSPSLFF